MGSNKYELFFVKAYGPQGPKSLKQAVLTVKYCKFNFVAIDIIIFLKKKKKVKNKNWHVGQKYLGPLAKYTKHMQWLYIFIILSN